MAKVDYSEETIAKCRKAIGMDSVVLSQTRSVVEVIQQARTNGKNKKAFKVVPFHRRRQRGFEKAKNAKKKD